jgi:excisionase family DNA binding protein
MSKALDDRAPTTPAPARRFYSIRQVAELTSLDVDTIYQAAYSGRLETVKFGRRRLVPDDAFEAFVAALRAGEAGE